MARAMGLYRSVVWLWARLGLLGRIAIGGIGCAYGGILAALARGLWGDPMMIDPASNGNGTVPHSSAPGQKAVRLELGFGALNVSE